MISFCSCFQNLPEKVYLTVKNEKNENKKEEESYGMSLRYVKCGGMTPSRIAPN